MYTPKSIVMLGATGAVGTEVVKTLLAPRFARAGFPQVGRLNLLGRRAVAGLDDNRVMQHTISIFEPAGYQSLLAGHDVAICTLGVGEPSKVSREDFIKIDKVAVLDFAKACKAAGVRHFELLASVGISSSSRNYYLRAKGELVDELEALGFERLSIFQPSMILTSSNRYGFSQGVLLMVWPRLKPLLFGGLRKYRGVRVEQLGKAIALNVFKEGTGLERLEWDDFQ